MPEVTIRENCKTSACPEAGMHNYVSGVYELGQVRSQFVGAALRGRPIVGDQIVTTDIDQLRGAATECRPYELSTSVMRPFA
jgi:hypothetical protein